MNIRTVFVLLICIAATACGSFSPALNKGEQVPPGKVLVIGKFIIDPPWYLNNDKTKTGEEQLNIMAAMTNDLSKKVKENTIYTADVNIDATLYEVFYFPLPPGTKYIRNSQVMNPVGQRHSGAVMFDVLKFYRNIKLDIPSRAKAVYVGTIVYKHDGKRMISVAVRDDYTEMLHDFAKMKIPGLKPADIVKKIAVVK
jgi:hypothetical protein